MTVCDCLREWLNEYEKLIVEEIATEIIEGEENTYSISKSPTKSVIPFNDGSKQITEYYQFFAKLSSQLPKERENNAQVLADFEEWIENRDFEEDYPDLSVVGRLTCDEITVNSSASVLSHEDNASIYHIIIAIRYLKERG